MVISERHFQQFIKGDEKSFESIFCQYYKTLVSYAMRHDLELMEAEDVDRKSTRLNSSHSQQSRMPSSA